MSNQLIQVRSGVDFSSTSISHWPNQMSYVTGASPDLSTASPQASITAWPSEMSWNAISDDTGRLVKEIGHLLQHHNSPAFLSSVSREMSVGERLFDATSAVKVLTAQVAMHMSSEWRDKLFSQIDSLHDLEEWDADDKPVERSSFASFLKAILYIRPQRYPGLGLSYDGNLVAAWTTGQDRLTSEFLARDRVRWVLTCNINGETERSAGETVVSRFYDCLAPYNPTRWFSREQNPYNHA